MSRAVVFSVARVATPRARASPRASRGSRTARAPTRTTCRARPRLRVSSVEPHSAHASRLGLRDGLVPVRALPDRDLVPPPDLARDVPVGRVLERVDREPVLRLRVVARRGASRSASSAGFFSSSIEHHHWSEISGSIRVSQRSQSATECRYASRFSSRPRSLIQSRMRSSASSCVRPASSPASSFIRPSGPITDRLGQAVVAPDLEVERVVAGRHLQRAGPELEVHALVGDHRHARARRTARAPRVPIASRQRSSSGFTATATSARIVAGRAVAIVTPPSGSSANG